MNAHHTYRFIHLRGGSTLVHDNTFGYLSGSKPPSIQMDEEEDWQTSFFSPLRTVWPAQDQVNNSFFWNNTINGAALVDGDDITLYNAAGATFIQVNRDYFTHAPAASGGYEYYTGARQGGSQAAPTTSDTGSMIFSATGANAYYPYSAYVYPHPLRNSSASGTSLQAPTGLRLQ